MICKNCNKEFTIVDSDREFYNKVNVPEPTHCPDCRLQRRIAWRNHSTLYQRQCDKTGKSIISVFPAGSPYTVYEAKEWFADNWDAKDYAKDFDFSRPFFDQFNELLLAVPRLALLNKNTENSDFCNYIADCKNCYLCSTVYNGCEDLYYSFWSYTSLNCIDIGHCVEVELCYNSVDCHTSYHLVFCDQCTNCRDCFYSIGLKNCHDCLFCSNLSHQQYCIANKQYTPEEYQKKFNELLVSGSYRSAQNAMQEFKKLKEKMFVCYANIVNCEDCSGNNLFRCKDCHDVYDSYEDEGCKWFLGNKANFCYDSVGGGGFDWSYECNHTGLGASHCSFCSSVMGPAYNLRYCENCHGNCKDCFGSVGLKNQQYCILNKQYSKEEYERLVPQIIEQMKKNGEWGEFFPISICPYSYNETFAQDIFPLTREQVLAKGWKWQDNMPGTFGKETITFDKLPDKIEEVGDNILTEVLACKSCKRNYKIIKQELDFYRKQKVALPLECPDCRHLAGVKRRNPFKLWHRQCMCENTEHGHEGRCKVEFETTYAPDRPERVYCEECYRKEIY